MIRLTYEEIVDTHAVTPKSFAKNHNMIKEARHMRKTLSTGLVVLLLLALTGSVFAAPASDFNAYSDVPAKHWAYDAVQKLTKAGIVEGYGDKTFRGDRTMTRYEMAQIVANAITKMDKADASNKALIEKLSKEFAAELKSLSARVAKLEDRTKVKFDGSIRVRLGADDPAAAYAAQQLTGNEGVWTRVRLRATADINDDTKMSIRLGTSTAKMSAGAPAAPVYDQWYITNTKNFLNIDLLRIGRQWGDGLGYGLFYGAPGNCDGIYLEEKIADKWKFKGSVFSVGAAVGSGVTSTPQENNAAGLTYVANKDTEFSAGYWWGNQPGTNATLNTSAGRSFASNGGWVAATAFATGDLWVLAEYGQTKLNNAVSLPDSPKAWMVQITNGKHTKMIYPAVDIADYKKPGNSAWVISYRSIEAGSISNGQQPFITTDPANGWAGQYNIYTKMDNTTGLLVAWQKCIAKNILFTTEVQDIKVKNKALTTLAESKMDRTYKAQFDFLF